MPFSRRSIVSIVVLLLLGVFVGLGYWYESRRVQPGQASDNTVVNVTNGGDRGAGTLREALFIAAAANNEVTISLQVPKITIETALPPLANSRGIRLVAGEPGNAEIDAGALSAGAVLDVAGANVTIEGIRIRNCKGAAILLRSERFRLQSTTLHSCDVGVDVAENASQALLERNRFVSNRVGVRFAGSNRNTIVVNNDFAAHRDAGIWAVRSEPDQRGAISIRENRFSKERIGILTANVSVLIERNELTDMREAAMQLMGPGAIARGNRISGGGAMGVIAENARAAVIEQNEFGGLAAYAVMLKGSADTLVRANRVHNSGYGLAFVLGDTRSPSSAIDNTIIEPKFNGIDVIGDSPILRGNQVVRPRALALKVIDFQPEDGAKVRSQPFLEGNNFDARGITIAGSAAPSSGAQR